MCELGIANEALTQENAKQVVQNWLAYHRFSTPDKQISTPVPAPAAAPIAAAALAPAPASNSAVQSSSSSVSASSAQHNMRSLTDVEIMSELHKYYKRWFRTDQETSAYIKSFGAVLDNTKKCYKGKHEKESIK